MKLQLLAVLSICIIGYSSCLEDSCDEIRSYIAHEPIYVQPNDFRNPPTYMAEKELTNPGKVPVLLNRQLHIKD